jgi:hypothetical protein
MAEIPGNRQKRTGEKKMNKQLIDLLNYIDSTLSGDEKKHASNVAMNVAGKWKDNRCYIIAFLHDIVEDGYATFEELQQRFDLDNEQMAALDAITRRHEERYFDYIERCKQNEMAKTVKLADLQDNIRRCAWDLQNRWGLIRRYGKAYGILIGEWKENERP